MIEDCLAEGLAATGLSQQEYAEVLLRLLDYGVICRDESQVEATLYDRYLRCAALVEDYLGVLGMRLQHDRQFAFLRLYPPGATVPGLTDDESAPFNGGLRQRPSQSEVAVILVLRVEYEKALREAQVDEKGRVLISLEALAIALNNLLKRNLPEGKLERKQLFTRLRQLRLIHYSLDDDLDSDESWISIQPAITSFVSTEVLQSLEGVQALTNKPDESPVDSVAADPDSLFEAEEEAR